VNAWMPASRLGRVECSCHNVTRDEMIPPSTDQSTTRWVGGRIKSNLSRWMDVGLSIVAVTLLHSLTPFHSYGSSLLQQQQEQELSRLSRHVTHTVPPKQSTKEEITIGRNRRETTVEHEHEHEHVLLALHPLTHHTKKIE